MAKLRVVIHGERATGKSTLQRLIQKALRDAGYPCYPHLYPAKDTEELVVIVEKEQEETRVAREKREMILFHQNEISRLCSELGII